MPKTVDVCEAGAVGTLTVPDGSGRTRGAVALSGSGGGVPSWWGELRSGAGAASAQRLLPVRTGGSGWSIRHRAVRGHPWGERSRPLLSKQDSLEVHVVWKLGLDGLQQAAPRQDPGLIHHLPD